MCPLCPTETQRWPLQQPTLPQPLCPELPMPALSCALHLPRTASVPSMVLGPCLSPVSLRGAPCGFGQALLWSLGKPYRYIPRRWLAGCHVPGYCLTFLGTSWHYCSPMTLGKGGTGRKAALPWSFLLAWLMPGTGVPSGLALAPGQSIRGHRCPILKKKKKQNKTSRNSASFSQH